MIDFLNEYVIGVKIYIDLSLAVFGAQKMPEGCKLSCSCYRQDLNTNKLQGHSVYEDIDSNLAA